MAKVNPSIYRKYVRVKNGQELLYVQLKKALHGTLRATLFFYKNLLKDIESQGFNLNIIWYVYGSQDGECQADDDSLESWRFEYIVRGREVIYMDNQMDEERVWLRYVVVMGK